MFIYLLLTILVVKVDSKVNVDVSYLSFQTLEKCDKLRTQLIAANQGKDYSAECKKTKIIE